MTVQDADPGLVAFRDEITALDLRLLETINARLETVQALQSYKAEHGLAFLDPDREAWLAEHLQQANSGPALRRSRRRAVRVRPRSRQARACRKRAEWLS